MLNFSITQLEKNIRKTKQNKTKTNKQTNKTF